MEIKSSVLDYLGKFENGIMVLIALTCDGQYYEGVFFYTSETIVFNVDEKLEQKLGCKIEEWKGYIDLLRGILKSVVPYTQMVNKIDNFDFTEYLTIKDQVSSELPEEVDLSEITHGTMSYH
jgi:hypothetical protein